MPDHPFGLERIELYFFKLALRYIYIECPQIG